MAGSGFADLHNHQFAHLAFGGVEFFGEPWGSIDSALPYCTPAHGLGGVDDVIGTVVKFAYGYPGAGLGHHVGGYPQYDGWPRWDSITHQTVHVDWLQRAWQGGLRLMVMLAVNSEFMAGLPLMKLAPGNTGADMQAVDLQLNAARAMETAVDNEYGGTGRGWYRIVTSPQQAAAAIAGGKLAVVLGIEVDHLFNSYLTANITADQVRAAVQEYYDKGVRYVFPLHFADNAFGGTGLQNALQGANAGVLHTPLGDLIKPYVLSTQDGHSLGYEYDGGQRNTRGLTALGQVLLQELMARGMIFDVDHMSYNTRAAALDMAEAAHYPVVSGHSGFIDVCLGDKRHEGQQTRAEVDRIRNVGGMVSPIIAQGSIDTIETWVRPDGTQIPHVCGGSINTFAQAYLYAVETMQGGAVAIGTDFNGFAGVPGPTSGTDACPGGVNNPNNVNLSGLTYPFKAASGVEMDRSQIGDKTFDINDDGLAHVGMLPDFVACLSALGVTDAELAPLLSSADAFVSMWAKAQPSSPPARHTLATGIGSAGDLELVTVGTDHAPYLAWQDHVTGTWHWSGRLPVGAAVGLTAVAAAVGNGGNLQVIGLGSDGVPYLIWQDHGSGQWNWYGALPHQPGLTFSAVATAVGNNQNLQVIALGSDGVPYLIWQDLGTGRWNWYGALPHQAGISFFDVVATGEVGGNLQVICLGTADQAPYLMWQDSGNGSWHWYGALPDPQGLRFRQAATGFGNGGNLQVICVGANDGQPYLIWQAASTGSWYWGGALPSQPGLQSRR